MRPKHVHALTQCQLEIPTQKHNYFPICLEISCDGTKPCVTLPENSWQLLGKGERRKKILLVEAKTVTLSSLTSKQAWADSKNRENICGYSFPIIYWSILQFHFILSVWVYCTYMSAPVLSILLPLPQREFSLLTKAIASEHSFYWMYTVWRHLDSCFFPLTLNYEGEKMLLWNCTIMWWIRVLMRPVVCDLCGSGIIP